MADHPSVGVVGADLVLVDDPFERGAIAQPVFKHFGRNSTQG